MKEIINWLQNIEQIASKTYSLAAEKYADDTKFKTFFESTAEDEAWHYHVMGSAANYFSLNPAPTPLIIIDKETDQKVSNLLSTIKAGLENDTYSSQELLEKVVELESSEWNDIFLYVINVLKEQTREFIYPAATMQTHIKKIALFLENTCNKSETLKELRKIPPVWVENILIVDDEPMITDLIKAILYHSGNIDIASNGKDALELIEKKFYKLILSDIDMPIMDGITLYQNAVKNYPKLHNRFLFMSGDPSPQRIDFFNEQKVKFLEKPMDINFLRKEAARIILS